MKTLIALSLLVLSQLAYSEVIIVCTPDGGCQPVVVFPPTTNPDPFLE